MRCNSRYRSVLSGAARLQGCAVSLADGPQAVLLRDKILRHYLSSRASRDLSNGASVKFICALQVSTHRRFPGISNLRVSELPSLNAADQSDCPQVWPPRLPMASHSPPLDVSLGNARELRHRKSVSARVCPVLSEESGSTEEHAKTWKSPARDDFKLFSFLSVQTNKFSSLP